MAKKKQQNISASVGRDLSGNLIIGDRNIVNVYSQLSHVDSYTPPSLPAPDELPEPGQLPPGSRMPYYRNAVFTGRETELLELAQSLVTHHASKATAITQTAVATGMGGIGKTQLAGEFCYRYGRYFHCVHWINARDGNLDAEIAACGREMGFSYFPETTQEQVIITLREWQKQPFRLLVLDNLEDPKVLSEWLPKLTGLRILVTARRQHWAADLGVNVYPLDTLPRPDSIALLRSLSPRLKDVNDPDIDALAERLGDLPLALDLAGRYLHARPRLITAEYLRLLDEAGNALEHTSFAGWYKDNQPTKHETSLVATFLLSWQQLSDSEVDGMAKLFFLSSGFLAPNVPIPENFFLSIAGASKNFSQEREVAYELIPIDSLNYQDLSWNAITKLQEIGLLGQALGVHPLLSEFSRLQNNELKKLLFCINQAIMPYLEGLETNPPKVFSVIRKHAQALAENFMQGEPLFALFILNSLGRYLNFIAEYSNSINTYKRAKELLLRVESEFDTHIQIIHIEILKGLGASYIAVGKLDLAKEMMSTAMVLASRYFPNSAIESSTANTFALILAELGFASDSIIYYQKAIENPVKDKGFATVLNNIGKAFQDIGRFEDAKKTVEAALEINLEILGEYSLETARNLNDLGLILCYLNQPHLAKEYLDRSIKISEYLFEGDHPDLAAAIGNMGLAYQLLMQHDDAIRCFEKSLSINQLFFGKVHRTIAKDLFNLNSEYLYQKQYQKALITILEAVEIDIQIFGELHLEVAKDFRSLSLTYLALEDEKAAQKAAQKAFEIDKKCPDVSKLALAEDYQILGTVCFQKKEKWKAQKYLEKALDIFRQTLPEDHHQIQITQYLLIQAITDIKFP